MAAKSRHAEVVTRMRSDLENRKDTLERELATVVARIKLLDEIDSGADLLSGGKDSDATAS